MAKTTEQDYEEERDPIEAVRLDSVPKETLEWLWKGRLPCGKFTLLDGDPSLGKSTMVCDLVARIITGSPMPDEEQGREPASVLMVCGEDGVADTIRPRLEAAGADLSKVYVAGASRSLGLPDDIDFLKAEVSRCSAALVGLPLGSSASPPGGRSRRRRSHIGRTLMPSGNGS